MALASSALALQKNELVSIRKLWMDTVQFSDENELKYSVSKEAGFLGGIGLFSLLRYELSR